MMTASTAQTAVIPAPPAGQPWRWVSGDFHRVVRSADESRREAKRCWVIIPEHLD